MVEEQDCDSRSRDTLQPRIEADENLFSSQTVLKSLNVRRMVHRNRQSHGATWLKGIYQTEMLSFRNRNRSPVSRS
jgi:hypothetical protein